MLRVWWGIFKLHCSHEEFVGICFFLEDCWKTALFGPRNCYDCLWLSLAQVMNEEQTYLVNRIAYLVTAYNPFLSHTKAVCQIARLLQIQWLEPTVLIKEWFLLWTVSSKTSEVYRDYFLPLILGFVFFGCNFLPQIFFCYCNRSIFCLLIKTLEHFLFNWNYSGWPSCYKKNSSLLAAHVLLFWQFII